MAINTIDPGLLGKIIATGGSQPTDTPPGLNATRKAIETEETEETEEDTMADEYRTQRVWVSRVGGSESQIANNVADISLGPIGRFEILPNGTVSMEFLTVPDRLTIVRVEMPVEGTETLFRRLSYLGYDPWLNRVRGKDLIRRFKKRVHEINYDKPSILMMSGDDEIKGRLHDVVMDWDGQPNALVVNEQTGEGLVIKLPDSRHLTRQLYQTLYPKGEQFGVLNKNDIESFHDPQFPFLPEGTRCDFKNMMVTDNSVYIPLLDSNKGQIGELELSLDMIEPLTKLHESISGGNKHIASSDNKPDEDARKDFRVYMADGREMHISNINRSPLYGDGFYGEISVTYTYNAPEKYANRKLLYLDALVFRDSAELREFIMEINFVKNNLPNRATEEEINERTRPHPSFYGLPKDKNGPMHRGRRRKIRPYNRNKH